MTATACARAFEDVGIEERAEGADAVTGLLRLAGEGDPEAMNDVMPLIYEALRKTAHQRMARERVGHTLSTTDLVHEAYLKLARLDRTKWQGRAHFLAVAAQTMRHILIDHALKRKADKRGGGGQQVPLDDGMAVVGAPGSDLLALDRAMRRLETIDARQCRVVECRIFGEMSVEETAETLGVSPASIKRDWALARAWLNRELAGGAAQSTTV
jgi:RNA polymerase sigma factor (TIGR02999 family)